jgi:hypothetical protein
MPTGDEVVFDWLKWPDTPYRNTPMIRLGQDEHGTWLFAPLGAAATYAGHGPTPLPVSFLTLLPRGEKWWIATWMRDNEGVDIDLYVDIVQPPRWDGPACIRVVDLDLDVIRRRGGAVVLDDEDEFELHTATLRYPPDVVDGARAAADAVFAAVTDGTPPFSQPPERWLAASRTAVDRMTS